MFFYKSKTEETKRGGKSAIWHILCCRLSITMVSTPPSSMLMCYIVTDFDTSLYFQSRIPKLEKKRNDKLFQVQSEKQNASKILQKTNSDSIFHIEIRFL